MILNTNTPHKIELWQLIHLQRQIDEQNFPFVRETTPKFYWSLALSGEIGELKNALKKIMRNKTEDHNAISLIKDACADTLIYIFITADVYEINLSEPADNILATPSIRNHYIAGFIRTVHFQLTHLDHNIMQKIYFGLDELTRSKFILDLNDLITILNSIAEFFDFDLLTETHKVQQENIDRFKEK